MSQTKSQSDQLETNTVSNSGICRSVVEVFPPLFSGVIPNSTISASLCHALFVVFILVYSGASAQNTAMPHDGLLLTVSPLAFADIFAGASYRLGAEFSLRNNISLAIGGGEYLKYLNAQKINPTGYTFKPAIKYYLNKNRIGGRYIALECQYKNQHFEFRDSMAVGTVRFERQYPMHRIVNALSIKYGDLINFGSRFIFEWYCGAGLRYIQSQSKLTMAELDAILTEPNTAACFRKNLYGSRGTFSHPILPLDSE